jgi:NAD(P)H-hydrate epimerase
MKLTQILPQHAYSSKQVSNNEANAAALAKVTLYQLMEYAGTAVFSLLTEQAPIPSKVLVVVGKGNNGGDGFVVARLALLAGYQVNVLLLGKIAEIQGDALTAMRFYIQIGGKLTATTQVVKAVKTIMTSHANVIVDGILGTGFKGDLSALFQEVIMTINNSQVKVISIDLPSGLNANTGQVLSTAVHANSTVTFIGIKKGLLTGQSVDYRGILYFADLGLTRHFESLVNSASIIVSDVNKPKLKPRLASSHKGSIGLVLTIGGGIGMPGAIRLCSEAALRCGAALVSVCCAQENQLMVLNGRPELMFAADKAKQLGVLPVFTKAKVITIGTGLGRGEWAEQLYTLVVNKSNRSQWLIFDADSLFFLAKHPNYQENRVLTPHPGEAATLLDCSVAEIEQDRFAAVKKIAKKYGGICVLKGAGSLISDGQQVWINTTGNAGMASGGMGDILTGIIAACCLQANTLLDAAILAVFIHGKAADIVAQQHGERGILASDLCLVLRQLINDC